MHHFRLLLISLVLGATAPAAQPLTAGDYATTDILGWTVHLEKSLDDHPRRTAALELLTDKLRELVTLLPPAALPELRKVPLWLSRNTSNGACYHPSEDWLRENNRIPEMARAIEFQNIDHFLDWAGTQPMMVLHELAHAWHDRVLDQGYENPELIKAHQRALASGKYDDVRHIDGHATRHYALTNPMEYFAEGTEAAFGKNDFQPFNRNEFAIFDPAGLALILKLWGAPEVSE